jgi:hypothetical protein
MADEFGGVPVTTGSPDGFGGVPVSSKPIQPSIIEDSPDASGYFDAFRAGLSNNETNQVYWLASRRFPDLVEQGIDPSEFYYFDDKGDLFYKNYRDGKNYKEFKDDIFGKDVDYVNNIGPTGQFLGEVIGGMTGMATGFIKGALSPNKVAAFTQAAIGGVKGTAIGGAKAYGIRAGLSAALGGPPLDAYKAGKDLAISSAFGGIPFGAPTSTAPKFAKGLFDKFPGTDGRSAIADIIQNGGKTVDEKLAYMAEKYPDVPVSRAEANETVGTMGNKLELWIAKNSGSDKLVKHYNDRNERVNYHAEKFFDFIQSGKYVNQGLKDKLTGKPAFDAELDVVKAVDDYIALEKKKLAERTAPMYRNAYDTDVTIDVSKELKQIQDVIADGNVSAEKKAIYKKLEQGLLDANTDSARNTTELLHQGLKDNFARQINKLSGRGKQPDPELMREVSLLRRSISDKIKEANPTYKEVTGIYDDAMGTAQMMDRSIVGQFASIVDKGGQKAATLTKRLFSGNIKPKEINELKGILQQTEDGATAWQNLKGTWLRTQWDDVIASQTNPLNQPNTFLRALGVPNPSKAMPLMGRNMMDASPQELSRITGELGEYNLQGTKAKMWEAIFEPEELDNFIDMTNMMQMVNKIQTASNSDTFSNLAIDELMTKEAQQFFTNQGINFKGGVTKTGGLIQSMINIPPRIGGYITGNKIQSPMLGNMISTQKDAYMDMLISYIVDPKKVVETQAILEATKPITYAISQTFARGGTEGLANLIETTSRTDKLREERAEIRAQEEAEAQPVTPPTEDLQGALQNFQMPQLNQPLFDEPSSNPIQMPSPTLLPNPKDQEIAMNQQMRKTGIAGLS